MTTMDGFLSSIEYPPNLDHPFISFFDEKIALYRIVQYSAIQKIYEDISDGTVTFKLTYKDSIEAEQMRNAIQGGIVHAFNRVFRTEQHLNGATLLVKFL